tara:strand:- start:13691 stop:13861 length:171 start_codon:yes stop_codon:yes gene_type:complete
MTDGNINVRNLIKKLQDVLTFLDENDLAIPAIKVEEAINALRQVELDSSEPSKHGR